MCRQKEEQGKNDKPPDMNVEMYENTRNRMLGTSKVIRLMKLWKVPAQHVEIWKENGKRKEETINGQIKLEGTE